VRPGLYPVDARHAGAEKLAEWMGDTHSALDVLQTFEQLGLLPHGRGHIDAGGPVVILEGYFNETLDVPKHQDMFALRNFSVIRLDGDTYESTIQALHALYPHLSVGGFVIVDDYMDWIGARQAVLDFRAQHSVTSPIVAVYHENVRFKGDGEGEIPRGVWWRK